MEIKKSEKANLENKKLLFVEVGLVISLAITLFAFCKYYKVKPMAKEDLPNLGASLKKGWKALLIPVVIFLPFYLDSKFKTTLFKDLIGDGAAAMSSCILLFTPGLAGMYAMLICKDKSKSKISHLADHHPSFRGMGCCILKILANTVL